ncbi:MAG: phage portal protein [Chloroflexota bacterium]
MSPYSTHNQAEMAYLDYLSDLEYARQRAIALARRYHDGDQNVSMTARIRQFLALHDGAELRMNVCRQVVTAITERLLVAGFDTGEPAGADGGKPQADWAWDTWQKNRMDAKQDDVHEQALCDGETFVIVDWNAPEGYARLTPHPRFVSVEAGGDGCGVCMIYPDDDDSQKPLYAVNHWTETVHTANGTQSRMRRTLYYPDRIERYVYNSGWQQYIEEAAAAETGEASGPAWPTPWRDAAGNPLGIPVVHFKNKGMRCEAWDAIPLQDGINKSLIDCLSAADVSAFRILFAAGWYPTTDGKEPKPDGSNLLAVAPGQIIGSTKPDARLTAIEGADISKLIELVQQLVMWLAMATSTPLSRFISSKQVASDDTLKGQDEPLENKVELRQTLFGNAWEDVMAIARRLANVFGGSELDESLTISTLWYRKRSLDELERKKKLGVPQEVIWSEMGYSPDQIEQMKAMPEYQAGLAMMQMGIGNENSGGDVAGETDG